MTVADVQAWWPAIVAGVAVAFAFAFAFAFVPLATRSTRREWLKQENELRRTTKELGIWKTTLRETNRSNERLTIALESERRKSDHYARAIARLVTALPTAEPLPTDPFLPHRRAVYDRLRLVVLDAFKDVQCP